MKHTARLNDWLQRTSPSSRALATAASPPDLAVIHELLAFEPREFRDFLADFSFEVMTTLLGELLERAHWLLSASPKNAVPVSNLALNFAKCWSGRPSDCERDALLELEGDACREYAHALLTVGDYDRARAAADEAAFLYRLRADAQIPKDDGSLLAFILFQILTGRLNQEGRDLLRRAAILGIITAQIQHGQGEHESALLLVEQSANVLLNCCEDKHKYVQGRTIYAKLLAEQKRYTQALEVLESTAAVARDIGDAETLGHLVNNIGWCYHTFFGDAARAKACFQVAVQIFDDLGLAVDALRPRNMLAAVLMDEGRYSAAVSELYMSRQAYFAAGLPNEAAEVMLRIIRAYILGGRQGRINWAEIRSAFSGAGVRAEVWHALETLQDLSGQRALTVGDLDAARNIMLNLTTGDVAQEAG